MSGVLNRMWNKTNCGRAKAWGREREEGAGGVPLTPLTIYCNNNGGGGVGAQE